MSDLESPRVYCEDNSGRVNRIEIPFEISQYTDVDIIASAGMWGNEKYTYTLSKERVDDDKWEYNFQVELPNTITQIYEDESYQKKIYPYGRTYYFSDMMYTSSYALLLASDCEGALERLFESELKFIWTNNELIQNIPLNDERY